MKKFKIGIQLYSIREEMEKDMDAALKKVKESGYDYVEFAGFFGKSAKEVKSILDKYELEAVSVHQGPELYFEEGQKLIDYLKEIGIKYCAIPWYTVDEYFNNWDSTMEKFNKFGEALKADGIQMLYHNHDFEFKTIDGKTILEKIYSEIPGDILQPEFDTCWVHYANNDPAAYIKKFNGKTDVIHLKDFVCEKLGGGPVYGLIGCDNIDKREETGFRFKPLGEGIQNWESILNACDEKGAEYLIVEQDEWYDEDPFECAKRSRTYLKDKFGI